MVGLFMDRYLHPFDGHAVYFEFGPILALNHALAACAILTLSQRLSLGFTRLIGWAISVEGAVGRDFEQQYGHARIGKLRGDAGAHDAGADDGGFMDVLHERRSSRSLEKVACGAFSDISFVSAGKKRGFCQLR